MFHSLTGCSVCRKPGVYPPSSSGAPECRPCATGANAARGRIRAQLDRYPLSEPQKERFLRVLTGAEPLRAFLLSLLTDRCVELSAQLTRLTMNNTALATLGQWVWASLGQGLIASPETHRLLADLAQASGDVGFAQGELLIANLLESEIGASAAGTEADPYYVVRTQDEYVVLRKLRRASLQRWTVSRHGRTYDVHCCQNGRYTWFDVSPQAQARARLGLPQAA